MIHGDGGEPRERFINWKRGETLSRFSRKRGKGGVTAISGRPYVGINPGEPNLDLGVG